jgi:hypothetical protein
MAIYIILWLVLLLISTPVGLNILRVTRATQFERVGDRFIISVWLGLATLSLLLLTASLGFALSPGVVLVLATGLLLISLRHRDTRRELGRFVRVLRPRLIIGATALGLGMAVYSIQPIRYYDTGLYHFGAVKWLSRFGAVTGISLLHIRFGSASSWFALSAPFNAGILDARVAMLLSGLALLLTGLHFILCLNRCLTNRATFPDWFMVSALAFLIPCGVYWKMFVSMAPDVPVMILTVIVAWLILIISQQPYPQPGTGTLDPSIIPFILAASALTDKLSALALLVATALFCFYRARRNLIFLVYLSLVGIAFLAPFIAYQVMTSGCPLFPTAVMCTQVPWSIGALEANNLTRIITEWSRWGGFAPPDAGHFDWLWRAWLTIGTTFKSVLAVFVATAVAATGWAATLLFPAGARVGLWVVRAGIAAAAIVLMFRAPNLLLIYVIVFALVTYRKGFDGKKWILVIGLLGAVVALCSAPSFRYNFGYITVLATCVIVSREESLRRAMRQFAIAVHAEDPTRTLMALLMAGGLAISLCRVLLTSQPPTSSPFASVEEKGPLLLFMPPHLPTSIVAPQQVNNMNYYAPVRGDQCWASELPCSTGILSPDVVLRDPVRGIAAGFQHQREQVKPPGSR